MDTRQLWKGVLSELENRLSKPAYQTWFTDTELEVSNDVWTVKTANAFAADWIADRYIDVLEEAIQAVQKELPRLQISHDRDNELSDTSRTVRDRNDTAPRIQRLEQDVSEMKKTINHLHAQVEALKKE